MPANITDLMYPLLITVVSALAGYLVTRKVQTADLAIKYQALASKQLDDNRKLEECQDNLETRVRELESALTQKDTEIARLKARVTTLEAENEQLRMELDKLTHGRKRAV